LNGFYKTFTQSMVTGASPQQGVVGLGKRVQAEDLIERLRKEDTGN